MFASKNNLDHLTFITDRNHIQIGGFTEEIMPLEPLAEKLGAFGFHVLSINGHNFQEISNALDFDLSIHRKPVWIIANTIPGKGVEYMENDYRWHGNPPGTLNTERTPPKEDQTEIALEELHGKEAQERGDWYVQHLKLQPLHAQRKKT